MRRWTTYTVIFCVLAIAVRLLTMRMGMPISHDVFGYYLYLPLVSIYGDLGLSDFSIIETIMANYDISGSFYQGHFNDETGSWVLRYPTGWAVLNAPFFYLGHISAGLFGYEQDGFSLPYQFCIRLGALTYTGIGIWLTAKILLRYFSDKVAAISIFLLVFGTNFYHQATTGAFMPHVYLFFLIALVVWLTIKWHENPKIKYALGIGAMIGLAAITRPTAIIVALIPLLWNIGGVQSLKDKWKLIKQNPWQIALVIVATFIVGMIQLGYWKAYSGVWLYNSYDNPGEGLDLWSPYTWDFLFSYRKGWYLYTPLMLLSTVGLFLLKSKRRLPLVVFFLFNLWLISSWTVWWYGASFSQRPMVDSYAVMALGFGGIVSVARKSNRIKQVLLAVIIVPLLVLNLFQSWQVERGIIHASRMTGEYYWDAFGATSLDDVNHELLMFDREALRKSGLQNEEDYKRSVVGVFEFDDGKVVMSGEHQYSQVFTIPSTQITTGDYAWIRFSLSFKPTGKDVQTALVSTYDHDGGIYAYRAVGLNEAEHVEPGKWNRVTYERLTPHVRSEEDKLSFYFWYLGGAAVEIDSVVVERLVPRN